MFNLGTNQVLKSRLSLNPTEAALNELPGRRCITPMRPIACLFGVVFYFLLASAIRYSAHLYYDYA